MSYFILVAELWFLLLLCLLLGRRVTNMLPLEAANVLEFYLAPILGLACCLIIVTYYGWFVAFKFQYTMAYTVVLVIFAGFYEKKPRQLLSHWWQIGVFSTICSLPIFFPIIFHDGYNPFTDIYTYLVHSQWLQSHAFSERAEPSGYFPYLTQISLYQNNGSRMGASFFLAYVQSIFHIKWSYNAYLPTVSLAFVTGLLAIGGVIRQLIPLSKIVVLALAALPCFTLNGFLFGAEWGFFPQTFGLSFALGFTALLPAITKLVCNESYNSEKLFWYALPVSISAAAMLFAYNEPFPLFAIALGLFILLVCLLYKNRIRDILWFYSIFLVQMSLLLNSEMIRIFKSLVVTLHITKQGAAIGWPVTWSFIQLLAHTFGMKSSISVHDKILSLYIFPVLLAMVMYLLFRFIRNNQGKNLGIFFLFTIYTVLCLFLIKFRYFVPNGSAIEIGQTFLQYKITKYAAPFALTLTAIAFAVLWNESKRSKPFIGIVYSTIFLSGLYYQSHISKQLTEQFILETNQQHRPFQALLMLRSALKDIPKDSPVYLAMGPQHHKLRQMITYVLHDRKLASDYTDDAYIVGHLPAGQRKMTPNPNTIWISMIQNDKDAEIVGPLQLHRYNKIRQG